MTNPLDFQTKINHDYITFNLNRLKYFVSACSIAFLTGCSQQPKDIQATSEVTVAPEIFDWNSDYTNAVPIPGTEKDIITTNGAKERQHLRTSQAEVKLSYDKHSSLLGFPLNTQEKETFLEKTSLVRFGEGGIVHDPQSNITLIFPDDKNVCKTTQKVSKDSFDHLMAKCIESNNKYSKSMQTELNK